MTHIKLKVKCDVRAEELEIEGQDIGLEPETEVDSGIQGQGNIKVPQETLRQRSRKAAKRRLKMARPVGSPSGSKKPVKRAAIADLRGKKFA